jgi:uncharacterized membrane protein YgdD (TMEM256/DUF423 family)
MAFALYFIGHLQATAREYWLSGVQVEWWSRLLTAGIAILSPDLQAFNLTDDVVAGTAGPSGAFSEYGRPGNSLCCRLLCLVGIGFFQS